jgi:hypothetical protein
MQRVNAPAGQMQLKGLIEAYVVSELSFIVEQLNVYLEVCVSNVGHFSLFAYSGCFKRKKRAARKVPRF